MWSCSRLLTRCVHATGGCVSPNLQVSCVQTWLAMGVNGLLTTWVAAAVSCMSTALECHTHCSVSTT